MGITFEKNENYWNADAIKLDGIEVNYFADSNTAWSAYQAGELDVLTSIPEGTVRDLYTQNSEELLTASKLHQQSIMINNQENHLGTVALRRAVISAIDRQAIIDSYSSGFLYSLLDGIVPPGCILDGKDFRETAGSYYLKPNADLEAAAKYLEEAGYPNGEGLYTLQILSTNNESALKIAQVIQEQLKAANINAEVVPIESKAFFPQVLEGKYDLAVSGSAGSIAYPTFFLTPSHSTPEANPDFYVNPAYDEMYDKALNSTSEADQLKYFIEAERIWIEDGARLPLYTGKSVILVKPNVEGVWMDGGGTKVLAEADIVQ